MTANKKKALYADNLDSYIDGVVQGLEQQEATDSLNTAYDLIVQDVRDAFSNAVSPSGVSWPARKEEGDGHPLLNESGALISAATGGAGHINENSGRELMMGVDGNVIPYATTHQSPLTSLIPEREYFGATDQTLDTIGELIADELLDLF